MKPQPWATTDKLKLGVQLSAWASLVLLYGLVFSRYFSTDKSLLRGLLNVLPMMALFYANLFFVNRFFERKRYSWFVICNLLLMAAVVQLRVSLNLMFPEIDRELLLDNEAHSWRVGAVVTSLTILVVSTFYQILMNRYENERRNLAIIQEQQEAQLQFLRAQINPHFLFNTLNNIYSLSVVKSDKTPEMVLRLSNLLRYVVYDGREEQVQLQRELQQIQEYIGLFQMRSEFPLDIQLEVEGQAAGLAIEPMILIPLVENSLKHCDFDTNPMAFAHFHLSVDEERLLFSTYNSKDDQQQKDLTGGVGLQNIRKRLQLKYPGRFLLKAEPTEDSFKVKLQLQFKN